MAQLLDRIVAGGTDQSVTIRIVSTTSTPVGLPREDVTEATGGLNLWYRRDGEAKVDMTPLVAGSLTGHTDNSIVHVDDGEYEIDLPDAAFAAGVERVTVGGTVTDGIVIGGVIELLPGDKPTFVDQRELRHRLAMSGTKVDPGTDIPANLLVTVDVFTSDAENQINAQLDTAIEDYRLDELVLNAAGTPTVNSLWSDLIADQTSASSLVDLIWTEQTSDHSGTAGSVAESLNAAGSAGDPWVTTLPGSYTGTQAGKILADVLADTADLQSNQGNWLTATGFSTHSAADVRTEIDANSTQLAAIVADTNELQTNQGNWLTATGFSTHSAADVYTQFTSASNADAFKADVSGLSTFDPTTDLVGVNRILSTTLTETTAGNLASNFSTFYDNADALTIKTVDSVGSGVGGGDDAATIYSYFTTSSRQDAFKADVSALSTVSTNVDAIKTKTDQLAFSVPGQVDANALTGGGGDDAATIYTYFTSSSRELPFQATGFSTHSAADVYTAFTSGSNEDVFKADVSALATQLSVDAVTTLVNSLNDISAADVYTQFTTASNADAFKADVSSLATAADLATVDTVADAIKTKTDQLIFTDGKVEAVAEVEATVAGTVDANLISVNGTTIVSSSPIQISTVIQNAVVENDPLTLYRNKTYQNSNNNPITVDLSHWAGMSTATDVVMTLYNDDTNTKIVDRQSAASFTTTEPYGAVFELSAVQTAQPVDSDYVMQIEVVHTDEYAVAVSAPVAILRDLAE